MALTGSRILLSGAPLAAAWAALAIGFLWAGGFFGRLTLQAHGAVCLLLALLSCGAPRLAASFLLGSDLPGPSQAALWAGAAAAFPCYWLAGRRAAGRDGFAARLTRLAIAAALTWLCAGLLAWGLTAACHAAGGAGASHAYCATLRTAVLVSSALLLAWIGARWKNWELSLLTYPLMALGAYRLLAEDLHQDRKAVLFLSLLVYGAALTALPRLNRSRLQNEA